MTINEWLDANGLGSASNLARTMGVDVASVAHWRSGRLQVPVKHCRALVKATGGEVTLQELRSDITWLVIGERVYIEVEG